MNAGKMSALVDQPDTQGTRSRAMQRSLPQMAHRVGLRTYTPPLATADGVTGSFSSTVSMPIEGQLELHFLARVTNSYGTFDSSDVMRSIKVDTKPCVPTGLSVVEVHDTWLLLRWNRRSETDIKGYNVYRNGNLVPYVTVDDPGAGNYASFPDMALTNGREYTYQVEAVDNAGNKSGLSGMVPGTPVAGPEWRP